MKDKAKVQSLNWSQWTVKTVRIEEMEWSGKLWGDGGQQDAGDSGGDIELVMKMTVEDQWVVVIELRSLEAMRSRY